jgi:segregation and condensation protein A
MDLLLYLVRKEEVDLNDIPIARILDQFVEHVRVLSTLDVDGIGDFLVMASTLMEIKSRMLLPQETEGDEEEEDPRFDLVQKLIEYRRFKEVSEELGDWREQQARKFPRGAVGVSLVEGDEEPTIEIGDVSLWDLCAAYSRILREIEITSAAEVVFDETPIEQHMDRVLAGLDEGRSLPFRSLFPRSADRGVFVGMFLAILELVRQGKIRVYQETDRDEILVAKREPIVAEPLPRETFVEGSGPDA